MGGGSWATALAKLLLQNCDSIYWYMRRDDRIADFKRTGHNPVYLSDIVFDTARINFSSDINEVCGKADTLLFAVPSPYLKDHLKKVTADLSDKYMVSAIKGIVPEDNTIVTTYMSDHFGIKPERQIVIGGPCHAEEVALGRRSYLTVGSLDPSLAAAFAPCLQGPALRTIVSGDVSGIEYGAVLKNVYGICGGIVYGLKTATTSSPRSQATPSARWNASSPPPAQASATSATPCILATFSSRHTPNSPATTISAPT